MSDNRAEPRPSIKAMRGSGPSIHSHCPLQGDQPPLPSVCGGGQPQSREWDGSILTRLSTIPFVPLFPDGTVASERSRWLLADLTMLIPDGLSPPSPPRGTELRLTLTTLLVQGGQYEGLSRVSRAFGHCIFPIRYFVPLAGSNQLAAFACRRANFTHRPTETFK